MASAKPSACRIKPTAPKTTFGRLDDLEPAAEPGRTWSITCFFVRRDMRGTGLMHTLIDAAVSQARRRKARLVEAYPVDEDSPSYRCMGCVPVFTGHGFRETGRAGSRRHVMRLKLAGAERKACARYSRRGRSNPGSRSTREATSIP